MKEAIYNLFLFIKDGLIYEIGITKHEINGTDEEKISHLQSNVDDDLKKAKRYSIPGKYYEKDVGGIPYAKWHALARMGVHLTLFRELKEFKAPESLLHCVTPVLDDEPRIDKVEESSRIGGGIIDKQTGKTIFEDYLDKYATSSGFNLAALLNDDYLHAIKLLYNQKHYVSSLKLIVSFIDTLAFLEYGDKTNIFKKWLSNFVPMDKIGITPSELWELRNAVLHMTNSESRKVSSGEVSRIHFYVSEEVRKVPDEHKESNTKYFNLKELLDSIIEAVKVWAKTFDDNPHKFANFVMRYDKVLSDVRYYNMPHKRWPNSKQYE